MTDSDEVFVAGKPTADIWGAPGLAWRAQLGRHLAGPLVHPRLRCVRRDHARFDLDNLAYPVLRALGIAACETIWASLDTGSEEGVYVRSAPPPPAPHCAFSVHISRPSAGSVAGRPSLIELVGASRIGVEEPLGLALGFDAPDVMIGTLSYDGPTKSLIDDLAPLFGLSVVNGKAQGHDHRVKELRVTRGKRPGLHGVTVSVWELEPTAPLLHSLGPVPAHLAGFSEENGPTMVDWFYDDDVGYLHWLDANPTGFVLNCARELRADYLMLHRSTCHTVSGRPARGDIWTSAYAKACSASREDLDSWARARAGAAPVTCPACHP